MEAFREIGAVVGLAIVNAIWTEVKGRLLDKKQKREMESRFNAQSMLEKWRDGVKRHTYSEFNRIKD